jgi:hypothetical protein
MGLSHDILWVDLGTDEALHGELNDAAIRSDGSVSIDCTFGSDFYIVTLVPKEGTSQLTGEFQKGRTSLGERGEVKATRYENADALVLMGHWAEDGSDYLWVAEIRKSKLRR